MLFRICPSKRKQIKKTAKGGIILMIYDLIAHIDRYPFPEKLKTALDFLAANDLSDKAPGKYTVDGTDITYTVMEKDVTAPCTVYESHKRYADIHFVIRGTEVFRMIDRADTKETAAYSEKDDYALYAQTAGSPTELIVRAGEFVVQYPDELHQPNNVLPSGDHHLKKAVVKVRMA